MLANLFVYLTVACAGGSAVALARSTFGTDQRARTRLRLAAAATAVGFVVCFTTAVRLAGLLQS